MTPLARLQARWRFAVTGILLAIPLIRLHAQEMPQRLVLVYAGGPHRPAYTVDDLVHFVAVVDTSDRPVDWLCDGVLFLEIQATSGRSYQPRPNAAPSNGSDWTAYLDSLFANEGPVARLDSAAGVVARVAGAPGRAVAVAIMVPYPDPRADTIRFGGHVFSMHIDSSRAAAAAAYMRDATQRFASRQVRNEVLVAFYWMNEGITSGDTALVRKVAAEVHAQRKRFLWIPAYRAAGWDQWRVLGFDQAWLQPNYFFHPEVPNTRLDSALTLARGAGLGMELEFDRRMFDSWQWADRLEPYLALFESAPDMRGRPIAIYEGGGALMRLARSKDAWHRALYQRLVVDLRPAARP